MQILGTIKVIKPIQQVSATFSKREFVIETNEQYVQTIQLELHGDRVDIIDSFVEGQEVECHINLRGREWVNPQGETKYFNSIQGWRIEKVQAEAPSAPQMPPMPASEAFEPATNFKEEEHDDLPF